jgi:hypothetical protein
MYTLILVLVLSSTIILQDQGVQAIIRSCSTVAELRHALDTVQPGDEIVLKEDTVFTATDVHMSGTGAHFTSTVNGDANNRITIRSQNPDKPSTLSGDQISSLHVFRLFGDYWTIKDIIVTHAQKGIVLDQTTDVHILGCEIFNIGMEAIHVRDGSQNALIEDCYIHHAGESTAKFGEGVYIGSDIGAWGDFDPFVNGTIVRGCTIGPEIGAEAFDIKEGTAETIIEHNVIDATGISGQGYADSFIDLKGTRTYVRYNTFYRNNAPELIKAIAIVPRPTPGNIMSTYEHVIHDNVFHLDDSGIPMVHAYSGFRDVYAFNNLPIDGSIADGVYKTCCPSWYTPPSNNTLVCIPPVGQYSFDVTNTSATVAWTGYASYFTVSYKKKADSDNSFLTLTSPTSPLVLNNLDFNATYEWEVQSNCADSESDFAGSDSFTTGQPEDGPPPYSEGSVTIYDDDLGDYWNDYSFNVDVDFADSSDPKYGSRAIKCLYGSYGGLNLKRSEELDVDSLNLTSFRFWAKGGSETNGPGDVGLRLEINNEVIQIQIMNDVWQYYEYSLQDQFDNPTSISSVRLQNDVGEDRLVYFDQIELAPDDITVDPTLKPSQAPITPLPTLKPSTSSQPTISSSAPSEAPVTVTKTPTSSPSSFPTKNPTGSPAEVPTPAPQDVSDPCAGSSCAIIYDDTLDTDWTAQYSFKCDYDLNHQGSAAEGSTAIRVSYRSYGALYLKHSSGLNTSGFDTLQFWMKGQQAGWVIRVKVGKKRYDVETAATWQFVEIPLDEFNNPSAIKKIYFQNRSSDNRIVDFDGVRLA